MGKKSSSLRALIHWRWKGRYGARLEKSLQIGGDLAAEAGYLGNLLDGCQPEALDGSELFEQDRLALLADAGEFIENAFGNLLQAQLGIIGVSEAVRFIADALQQFERARIVREPKRLALAGPINLLELLGQANDWNMAQAQLGQFGASGAKLAFAAVDQNQVGHPLSSVAW